MARQPARKDLRIVIAQEAARAIAEEGVRDYALAKRKAAARLGVRDLHGNLPSNVEIEAALEERQRLFGGASHGGDLARLRRAAVAAMRLFQHFEPRLVGPVLTGTATAHDLVQLHLFTDSPEQVSIMLLGLGIPHEELERRLKRSAGGHVVAPTLRFVAGEVAVEAIVFEYDGLREAPVSLVDGKPMRRANLREVEALLAAG